MPQAVLKKHKEASAESIIAQTVRAVGARAGDLRAEDTRAEDLRTDGAYAEDARAEERRAQSDALCAVVLKAAKGERAALAALCEAVGKQVLFSVRMMYGGGEADVEDIVQEVLMRMCANIHSLKDARAFKAWLGRLVVNQVHTYRRKNAAGGQLVYLDEYMPELPEENDSYLPQENFMRQYDATAVRDIVKTFPNRQREAVVLHYYEGMTISQTARAMDVTHQSIMQYLDIAHGKLRSALEKRGGAMENLAVLPMGALLTEMLHSAAGRFAAGDAMLVQKMAQGVMKGAAVAGAAGAGAAKAAAGAGAAKAMAGAGAAKAAAGAGAAKAVLAPLAGAVATVMITAGSFTALRAADNAAKNVPQASIIGGVSFTGGQAREGKAHLNPGAAQVNAYSENGALTVNEWWITPAGNAETVLYSGTGQDGDANAALAKLNDGVYVIYFRLSDGAGFNYRLNQNFRVDV